MVVFLWWCFWGGVFGVVSCGGVFVVVFLSLCLCGGVFVVVFLRWCFCAGVFVVVFLWWCFCGGVFVVWLRWCSCGGVFVAVFLWCGCGGVLVVVFLWRCFCGGVLVVVYKVLLQYYKVLLQYYKVLLRTTKYYSVLQSTTPVLLRTTKYYSSTTKYYSAQQSNTPVLLRTTKVLLQYYSVLQSTTPTSETTSERRPSSILLRTTPVLQKLPKRSFRARLPPNFTERASKTSVSRDASDNFHRKSFQKDRFVRGFLQISQKKLPKRAFRAMLLPKFTEQAFKTSVPRDASDNFHRKSFQKDRFVRGFLQISQKKLPKRAFRAMLLPKFTEQAFKTSVPRDASDNFHRKSFQKDRFVRGFLQISQKKLPNERFARCFLQNSQNKLSKRAFRAMLPTIFTRKASKMIISREASSKFERTVLPKRAFRAMLPRIFTQNLRFATVSRDRHTDSCERVHLPKAKCASHYNAVHSQMSKCTFRYSGVRKNV